MFKKLINRSEGSQVEMIDSVLGDIIPSNDVTIIKKPRKNRLSSICKVLILIFILGLLAIGIVILALIITYSGKSFMNYIIQTSGENLLPLSNQTRVLPTHQENLTATLDEQNWKKVTVLPASTTQQVHIPSSIIRTKQENKHLLMNTKPMKPYPSSNTMVNEQTTSTVSNRQSSISSFNREYDQTSEEHRLTTAEILTPTLSIQKIRDLEMTTTEKIPLATQITSQSSTNKYKMILAKYKKLEEDDDVIDDLLFS